MSPRANYFVIAPKAMDLLMQQERYLEEQFEKSTVLNKRVWELVKLRVSQLNQCAFCIDMHTRDLVKMGESSERLVGLCTWDQLPYYSEAERAALYLADRLTTANEMGDDTYRRLLDHLGEQGIVDMSIAVNAINSWNRIAKTFKPAIGSLSKE